MRVNSESSKRVMINVFGKPANVAHILIGHPVKLKRGEDWQVLAQREHYTIAYDYEEGIKIETTTDHIREVTDELRSILVKHKVPVKAGRHNVVSASLCEIGPHTQSLRSSLLDAGWSAGRFNFTFDLTW